MKKLTKLILAIAILAGIVAVAGKCFATDYYLSPNGDDANAGTIEAPWKTLEYAIWQLNGGDALKLMEGTHLFTKESDMSNKGRADAWIDIGPAEGANPIIKMSLNSADRTKWWIRSYVRIHDLSFTDTGMEFLLLKGDHIIVENCTFRNGADLIWTDPNYDIIIRNNEFWLDNPLSARGIVVRVTGALIEHNTFHFVSGSRGYAAISTWGEASNVDIRYNTFIGEPGTYVSGEAIWLGQLYVYYGNVGNSGDWESSNIFVHDNIMVNIPVAAVSFKHARDCSFINNIYYNPTYKGNVVGIYGVIHTSRDGSISNVEPGLYHDPKNLTIKNNIFVSGNLTTSSAVLSVYPKCNEGLIIDNNIWNTPAGNQAKVYWLDNVLRPFSEYQSISGQDSKSLFSDPLFVDAAGGNFQLSSNSPAIDVGSNLPFNWPDCERIPRPQGTSVDIGAFEYNNLEPTQNKPPFASIFADKYGADPNEQINFRGGFSFDPDGRIVSYLWDFGDGTTMQGKEVIHSYTNVNKYQVSLTVTDDKGAKHTSIREFNIRLLPIPKAVCSPRAGEPGVIINFDGSQSYDPDGSISSYKWNFGPGNEIIESDPIPPAQTFQTAGFYNARLQVTDNDGNQNQKASAIRIPVGAAFYDFFDAQLKPEWQPVLGNWTVVDGRLVANLEAGEKGIIVLNQEFQPDGLEFQVDLYRPQDIVYPYIAFDYKDENNFKYVRFFGYNWAFGEYMDGVRMDRKDIWIHYKRINNLDDDLLRVHTILAGNLMTVKFHDLGKEDKTTYDLIATGKIALIASDKPTYFDNFFVKGTLAGSTLPGDFNGDRVVDIKDLILVAKEYGVKYNISHIILVAKNYGRTL